MKAGVAGTVLSSSAEDDGSDERRFRESGCRAGGDRGLGGCLPQGSTEGIAGHSPAHGRLSSV